MNAQQAHWLEMGQRLGYPVCCIRSFIKMLHLKEQWPNKWAGTGYVPCRLCAKRPMMEVQGRINQFRDPALPSFPSEKV